MVCVQFCTLLDHNLIIIVNLFQQFPYPKYTQNFFIQTVQGLLPLLMTLAFMYSAVMVIKVSFLFCSQVCMLQKQALV